MKRKMIWHDVLQPEHVFLLKFLRNFQQLLFSSYFRVYFIWICCIVSVCAAGPRFENRLCILMADPELLDLGDDCGGIVEAEILGQLDAISGERYGRRH